MMNRRTFLLAAPCIFHGCGPSRSTTPSADQIERERHLAELAECFVRPGSIRTTPPRDSALLDAIPELKPLVRVALRLHPRSSDEPAISESKLGGSFLWPADQAWPQCPEFRIPMAAVLQLTGDHIPPQFPMRPGCDLFQLFWTPRATKAGPPHLVGAWTNRNTLTDLAKNPPLERPDLGFVPVPCRPFPERIAEYPPLPFMPKIMRDRIRDRKDKNLEQQLASPRGCQAGGWPRVPTDAPKCHICIHPMDYLLTIDSVEWTADNAERWKPAEDQNRDGYRRAAGFQFGSEARAIQVYLCKRCENWPLRAIFV